MGLISRVATTGLLALAIGGSYRLFTERHQESKWFSAEGNGGSPTESEYFSPAEDLERIDVEELGRPPRASWNTNATEYCDVLVYRYVNRLGADRRG